MRSELVTIDTKSALIRSRVRRTAIIEAQYKQVIVAAHPEIVAYESAQLALSNSNLPIDAYGRVLPNLSSAQQIIWDEYVKQRFEVEVLHPVGAAYAVETLVFVPVVSRMASVSGTAFDMSDGMQFSDEQLLTAFDSWLDGQDEAFWLAVRQAIARVDAPLTGIEARPPETLTEAEKADPLSDAPAAIGSGGSKSAFTHSPKSGAVSRKKATTKNPMLTTG